MDTLTTTEVADYCGVHFRTVIRWINKGILIGFKLPGRGDNRVLVQDLANFMITNEIPIPDELLERLAEQQNNDKNKSFTFCSTDSQWHASLSEQLTSLEIQYNLAKTPLDLGYHLASHQGYVCIDLFFFSLSPTHIIQWLHQISLQRNHTFILISREKINDFNTLKLQTVIKGYPIQFHSDINTIEALTELMNVLLRR